MKTLLLTTLIFVQMLMGDTAILAMQSPENVVLANHALLGPAKAVAVEGRFAYLAAGGTFVVIDIQNPEQPIQVAATEIGDRINDIFVANSYAYLAASKFHIFDLTDPYHPQERGVLEIDGSRVVVKDNYAYLCSGALGLRIIDIADKSVPMEVGVFDRNSVLDGVHADNAVDVRVLGELAYVGFTGVGDSNGQGFWIVNIADKARPQPVGFYDPEVGVLSVETDSKLAYLGTTNGLQIIDLADETPPRLLSTFPDEARDLKKEGDVLHLASRFGILALDISNPANPQILKKYFSEAACWRVQVLNGITYAAADYQGLQIVDISPVSASKIIGGLSHSGAISRIWAYGNHVYLVEGRFGRPAVLRIMSIADPVQMNTVAHLPIEPVAIAFWQHFAYVLTLENVQIWDISFPEVPQTVGQLNMPGARHIEIHNGNAYVTTTDEIHVFDLSDPVRPAGLASTLARGIVDIEIYQNYLFALLQNNPRIEVFEVSIPSSPSKISITELNDVVNSYSQVHAAGSGLCIISWCNLHLFDVTKPEEPFERADRNVGCYLKKNAFVTSEKLFLTNGETGIEIFDLSRMESLPKLGGYIFGNYLASDVYADQKWIYLAYADAGLHVLWHDFSTLVRLSHDKETPVAIIRVGSYPNPFNGSTRIEYQIMDFGLVDVRIFDLFGREVKSLSKSVLVPGVYKIDWDGQDSNSRPVASGAYCVRVQLATTVVTNKILLIR